MHNHHRSASTAALVAAVFVGLFPFPSSATEGGGGATACDLGIVSDIEDAISKHHPADRKHYTDRVIDRTPIPCQYGYQPANAIGGGKVGQPLLVLVVHLATEKGRTDIPVDVVRAFIDAGASLTAVDDDGKTANDRVDGSSFTNKTELLALVSPPVPVAPPTTGLAFHRSSATPWGYQALEFDKGVGNECGALPGIIHPDQSDGRGSSKMTIRCLSGNCGGAMIVQCRFDNRRGICRGQFRFLREIQAGKDVVMTSRDFQSESGKQWTKRDSTIGAAKGVGSDGLADHDDLSCRVLSFGEFEGLVH